MIFCKVRFCFVVDINEREEREQKKKIICEVLLEKVGILLVDNVKFFNYFKIIKLFGLFSFYKDVFLSMFISKIRMCNE